MVPRMGIKKILEHFDRILSSVKVEVVVINGDVKHEFGEISRQEWRATLKLLDYFIERGIEVVLVKGNHDKILGPIAEKRDIETVDSYLIGNVRVLHGHEEGEFDEKLFVIGHDHPCISLREGARVEKYKCFLKGKWKRKEVIVIPSFNFVTEGTDIRREDLLSPYLKQSLDNFEVWIVDDSGKVYEFGRVKNIG
jgi:putative SbcD/Mre11-related phosphoesterase